MSRTIAPAIAGNDSPRLSMGAGQRPVAFRGNSILLPNPRQTTQFLKKLVAEDLETL